VIPPAVLLTPSTGTPACWAMGLVILAVLLNVGPMMTATLSPLISLL
jgi:hypothetical protein